MSGAVRTTSRLSAGAALPIARARSAIVSASNEACGYGDCARAMRGSDKAAASRAARLLLPDTRTRRRGESIGSRRRAVVARSYRRRTHADAVTPAGAGRVTSLVARSIGVRCAVGVAGSCGRCMLAGPPAAGCEVALARGHRRRLERRRHRIVPAIEEAEEGDHAQDLDDLVVGPMTMQRSADRLVDRVGDARGGQGEFEGRLLGLAEERAAAEVPDLGQAFVVAPKRSAASTVCASQ